MAGIVFYAMAVAEFPEHLKVKPRSLLDPLSLQKLSLFQKIFGTLFHLILYLFQGRLKPFSRCYPVAVRKYRNLLNPFCLLSCKRVKLIYRIDVVSEKLDPYALIQRERRVNLHYIPSYAECASAEFDIRAYILHFDKPF